MGVLGLLLNVFTLKDKMDNKYNGLGLNEYQIEAMSFRLPSAKQQYARDGLVGEVGELFSLYAKARRDGIPFDFDLNVKKELGDILWFVAAIAADHGYTLEEIGQTNLSKLSARKSNGTLQGSGDHR